MRFLHLLPAVLLAVLVVPVPVRADEATNVQLNAAHSGGSITGAMSPALTRAWTVDLGAVVYGAAIANGQVYAATDGKNTGAGTLLSTLYALDAGDGSIVWGPVTLAGVLGGSGAPVYENGRVYVLSSNGTLQAFDAQTGLPLWSQALAGDSYGGFNDAPAIKNGVMYVAGGNQLFALDAVSGAVRWNITPNYGYSTTPTVADDALYVGFHGPKVYKLDPATGALIWSYVSASYYYSSEGIKTAVYRGRVYAADGPTGSLILDAATGHQVGSAQYDTLPALALNDAYFPSSGSLQRRDLTGAASAWTFTGDTALTGLPLYLNGYLYMTSTKGNVYGVDAASGQQVWTDDLSAFLPTPNYYDYSHHFTGLAAAEGCLAVPIGNSLIGFSYTVARVPLIDPPVASAITGRGATVTAALNPNGAGTTAHVEYGTDASYGSATADFDIGQGSDPVTYSAALSGLAPGTLYHFRVVALNANGPAATPDQTLTTGSELAPSEKTALPTASSQSTATINGTVNPNGLPTQAYFEYGTTTAYGSSTPAVDVGGLNQWMPVTAALTGLGPNVEYHYRVTAMNSAGTTSSGDQGFLTPPAVQPTVVSEGGTESTDGVVLTASVNPNAAATTGSFEYWSSYNYYSSHSFTPSVSLGGGTSPVPLSATLPTNLAPGSYYYRAVTVNSLGTTSGATMSLSIQGLAYVPTVTTGDATSITNRSATVAGNVVSTMSVTTHLEYGLTDAYGQTASVTTYYYGGPVSAQLYSLAPGMTYHYRLVSSTANQTGYGADKTFTTALYSSVVGATDDVAYVSHDQPVQITVLANDLADAGETLTVVAVTQGSYGQVTFDPATGLVTYTPHQGFVGPDTFAYTVSNPHGDHATGHVQVSRLESALAGNYSGVLGEDGDKFEGRGQVTLSVTAAGAVSGKIKLGAGVWSLTGKLLNGKFRGAAKGAGQPALTVHLDIDPDALTMSGAVSQGAGGEIGFVAGRSAYTLDAPNALAGRYTLTLPPVAGTSCVGNGYATMSVSLKGAVTVVGKMGDGKALSASSYVDGANQFPLYCCLNARAKESLTGSMTIEYSPSPLSDVDGSLSWISAGAALLSANQASVDLYTFGSYYTPPAKGTRVLDYPDNASNAVLTVVPDDDAYELPYVLTLSKGNTLVAAPHSGLALSLNVATGLFVGRMYDPIGHRMLGIGGVILQGQQRAYGLYASPAKVLGTVNLAPN